jgi:hypothetical protein
VRCHSITSLAIAGVAGGGVSPGISKHTNRSARDGRHIVRVFLRILYVEADSLASSAGDRHMRTKPATALSLGAMILTMSTLAQTTAAATQPIEMAQTHFTESREACDRAGGRYEEGPGYFACIDGRRNPEAPCAESERATNHCPAIAPPGTLSLLQRTWSRLKNFGMGR